MTENLTVGAGDASGASGEPTSQVSQAAAQPIEGNVNQLLAGLGEKFDGLERQLRGLQGRQDKAENNFRDQLARFNSIKSQGNLSDEQALDVMQRGDAETQRWTNLEKRLDDLAGRIAGAGTQANERQAVTKVFESLGLDTKDPRVASALVRKYDSPDAVELAAYRLQRELAQSPNPNQAQAASIQGGGATAASVDDLLARMDKAMLSGDFETMQKIEQELKAAGAPGWG